MARARSRKSGFSLVEVALSLGIIGFAFVALLGMLPVGLDTFQEAIDSTVQAQIAQSIMTKARQTKFSELTTFDRNADEDDANPKADFFFNEEGTTTPTTTDKNYIYSAAVQVFYSDAMPLGQKPASSEMPAQKAHQALIRVTVKRVSAPKVARTFSAYVANNGL